VPFVVYSGAFQDSDASPELLNAVWIEKPAAFQTLHEALARLQVQPAPQSGIIRREGCLTEVKGFASTMDFQRADRHKLSPWP
jgi:hypothetical protein